MSPHVCRPFSAQMIRQIHFTIHSNSPHPEEFEGKPFTVNLPKGTYVYYSTVPGDEPAGMQGSLIVK